MKQIEMSIMGQSYLLGCSDAGEHSLRQAVQKVDQAMCQIRDAGKIKARERIAVLAAVNLAFSHEAALLNAQSSAAASVATGASAPSAQGGALDVALDSAAQEKLQKLLNRIDQVFAQDSRLL